jgi:hypothetical protein
MKMIAILALALGAAAETPPGVAKQPENVSKPDLLRFWPKGRNLAVPHMLPDIGASQRPAKPCSIPLVNVTPKVQSRMPVVPPERLTRTVKMPNVEMPAPPCPEDKKD